MYKLIQKSYPFQGVSEIEYQEAEVFLSIDEALDKAEKHEERTHYIVFHTLQDRLIAFSVNMSEIVQKRGSGGAHTWKGKL